MSSRWKWIFWLDLLIFDFLDPTWPTTVIIFIFSVNVRSHFCDWGASAVIWIMFMHAERNRRWLCTHIRTYVSSQTHTHSHARTHGAKQQFTFLMRPSAAPNNYNEIRDRKAKGLKLSFSSGWRVVSFFFFFFSKSNWILARGRIFSTLCRRPTPEHRSHRCRRRRRSGCRRGRRGRRRGRRHRLMSVKPFFLRH